MNIVLQCFVLKKKSKIGVVLYNKAKSFYDFFQNGSEKHAQNVQIFALIHLRSTGQTERRGNRIFSALFTEPFRKKCALQSMCA